MNKKCIGLAFFTSTITVIVLFTQCGGITSSDNSDSHIESRASSLVSKMTLDEKIQLVHGTGDPALDIGGPFPSWVKGAGYIPGIPRLGIPAIASADASSGANVTGIDSTALPAPIGLAASWDPKLAESYSARIATELRQHGYSESLGGGIGLAREPRSGRTFENLGEDPVLAGKMSAGLIHGTHAKNVMATVKHYAFNGQETNRMSGSDSIVDERTMRETELLAFEIAIFGGKPSNVMCGYNKVNGTQSCENNILINEILKKEWGFEGVMLSDWAATHSTVKSALSGLDEEQPSDVAGTTYFGTALKEAIKEGHVPMSRLNDMVKRKLKAMIVSGVMDNPPTAGGKTDKISGNSDALTFAHQSFVLLKNSVPEGMSDSILPLSANDSPAIVVIGGHADVGVLSGGGSGGAPAIDGNAVTNCKGPVETYINTCATWYKSSPLTAIRAKIPQAKVTFFDGTDAVAAANAASKADVTIIFATQWETEGVDLSSLALPDTTMDPYNQLFDQNGLITTVAAKAKKVIVVLENGSPVLMPWLNNVDAVVEAWYPGIQGGQAIADVLFGDSNPSGKLPLTFPKADADLPQVKIDSANLNVIYNEKLLMGYRWYDAKQIEPLFPFGFGLSYTTFEYSDMDVRVRSEGNVLVTLNVKNTGKRKGSEIVQIYSTLPEKVEDAPQRLVGWSKVALNPGESRHVNIVIPAKRFAIWNTAKHRWEVSSGLYEVKSAASSRDPNAKSKHIYIPGRMINHGKGDADKVAD